MPQAARIALWRVQANIKKLASKLETFQSSKGVHNVLSQSWILRVMLTAPNVSGRAMAEAFHLVVGSDRSMVSRESVKNIRAAFLEMWKNLIFASVREFMAATGAIRFGASPNALCVHVSHVQDEDIPVELEALADKTAPTLATSFERLVKTLLENTLPKPQPATGGARPATGGRRKDSEPEVWLVHAIIGDGIPTNAAAAKLLWAVAATGALSRCKRISLPLLQRISLPLLQRMGSWAVPPR